VVGHVKTAQVQVKYHDLITSTLNYQNLNCLYASNKRNKNVCVFAFISVFLLEILKKLKYFK